MYLQPIKNDDPQLDFYTMYKRETMEYDTEYMNKYNEDLNTTLIFVSSGVPFVNPSHLPGFPAGLFSAVSSAFVIAIQPELQPDPSQQSEAYLRAILLTLNPSISPDEHPAAPPAWSGPPPPRDHHDSGSFIRKFVDVTVGRIRCDVGQTVVEQIPPSHWWICNRTLRRPATQV
jgi:hypothetical protein